MRTRLTVTAAVAAAFVAGVAAGHLSAPQRLSAQSGTTNATRATLYWVALREVALRGSSGVAVQTACRAATLR
jgi:hypothetical protein